MDPRRTWFGRVAAALLLAAAGVAHAQYPTRPVKIVVPFPPGGSQDTIARALAARLAESMHQPFVVENRPGAGGNIGAEAVARSQPDGYTLLAAGASIAITPHLQKAAVDPLRELAGTSLVTAGPFVLVAHPSAPFATFEQFVAHVKANPGRLNYGSQGPGSVPHLAMEYLKSLARIDLQHVPYKGGAPNVQAVLAGEVTVTIESAVATLQHVRAGRLRALAVTVREPVESLPGVPPIARSVPGYELSGWQGLWLPAGTPADIRTRLADEIARAARSTEVSTLLRTLGTELRTSSPAETDAFVAAEHAKWGQVIRDNGIRAD